MNARFETITGETWRRSLIAARQRFAGTTDRIRSQIPANHLMPTPTPRPLAKQILDLLCRQGATGVSADDIMKIIQPHMEDAARLDWLISEEALLCKGHQDGYFITWGEGEDQEWQSERYQTPREAIDAARKASA